MTVENLTLAVAKRVCAVDFKDLDSDTRTMTKQLIADGVAVAIAGSLEEPPRILAQYAQDLSSAPRASVWGFGFKTHPAQAAFVNAASMHVLDFEPMSNPPTHAVSPTVPVAFVVVDALEHPATAPSLRGTRGSFRPMNTCSKCPVMGCRSLSIATAWVGSCVTW
jgi:hypothetical protein